MTQATEVVWVKCNDCGNTLSGNAKGALRWTRCPACSSSRMVFAAPFAAAGSPPAQAGQLLSRWQAEYRAAAGLPNPQPIYGPKAAPAPPPVQPAVAPAPVPMGSVPAGPPPVYAAPPAPYAPAPAPDAAHAPTPLATPIVAGPQRPRRTAAAPVAPKQGSKTLVIVRLLVAGGAVMITGVILVVFMLTRGQQPPEPPPQDPPTAANPSTPAANRTAAPRTPRVDADKTQAKRASSTYLGKVPGWVEMLGLRGKALTEAYAEMTAAHESWRKGALDQANAGVSGALEQKSASEAVRAKAGKDIESGNAALKKMREEQNPLARFVMAYGSLDGRIVAHEEAKTAWKAASQKRAEADDAYRALEAKLLETSDLAAQARLEKEVQAAAATYKTALEAETTAQAAADARRQELAEARAELDGAAARIPADTADGAVLQPAWGDYMKASAGIRDAESVLATHESRMAELATELSTAQATLEDRRREYKSIHAEYLAVASEFSKAIIEARNNPSPRTKKNYEDLKVKEARAKEDDLAAKARVSESEKAIRELKDRQRKAERDVPRLQESIDAAVKSAAGSKAKFEQALAPIKTRVAGEESAREAEMRRIEGEVAAARARQAESAGRIRELDLEIGAARAEISRIEKTAAQFDTPEIAGLPDPLPVLFTKLGERLEGFQKLDYLTAAQAQSVLDRVGLIETALTSLTRVTNQPEFGERLTGDAAPILQKWRTASTAAMVVATDLREATEALTVMLGGTDG